MIRSLKNLASSRLRRHVIFWICWVAGFTFIKSFGRPPMVYAGWLAYYVLTLPIFVSQTYLVAYVLIPKFLDRKRWPLFLLTFSAAFYGYSCIELIISNEWIFPWAPTGTLPEKHYLDPVNVIGSGIGNLYIVLVFLAVRTFRNWYVADRRANEIQKVRLKREIDNAMNRFQPMMLLDAMDRISAMAAAHQGNVTRAIALTSELLGEVIMYNEEPRAWFNREILLVRKQLELSAILHGKKPEVEITVAGDPSTIQLPRMILFSFLDMFLRKFRNVTPAPSLHIEVSGYSRMVTLQILSDEQSAEKMDLEVCLQALHRLDVLFGDEVCIDHRMHPYGCTVIFRTGSEQAVTGDHALENGVHLQKSGDG